MNYKVSQYADRQIMYKQDWVVRMFCSLCNQSPQMSILSIVVLSEV